MIYLKLLIVSKAILGISYPNYVIFGLLAVRFGSALKKLGFGLILNIRTENSVRF